VEKTFTVYDNPGEMKAAEYRYWQSRPASERMQAVSEITLALYTMKGSDADVSRLQRVISVVQR
jgi:hypothetical protein